MQLSKEVLGDMHGGYMMLLRTTMLAQILDSGLV